MLCGKILRRYSHEEKRENEETGLLSPFPFFHSSLPSPNLREKCKAYGFTSVFTHSLEVIILLLSIETGVEVWRGGGKEL